VIFEIVKKIPSQTFTGPINKGVVSGIELYYETYK
jgi:hypothetical protein